MFHLDGNTKLGFRPEPACAAVSDVADGGIQPLRQE
jgi:hypothetical protein